MLKALILASVPSKVREEIRASFRGAKAHEFEWLRDLYLKRAKGTIPKDVVRELSNVASWSTDMRYDPGSVSLKGARAFLRAAGAIMGWADERM